MAKWDGIKYVPWNVNIFFWRLCLNRLPFIMNFVEKALIFLWFFVLSVRCSQNIYFTYLVNVIVVRTWNAIFSMLELSFTMHLGVLDVGLYICPWLRRMHWLLLWWRHIGCFESWFSILLLIISLYLWFWWVLCKTFNPMCACNPIKVDLCFL